MRFQFTKILSVSLALFFLVYLLSACSFDNGLRLSSGNSSAKKHMSSSFALLSGENTKEIKLKKDATLVITYNIKIESGDLKVTLNNPKGSEIVAFNNTQKGKKEIRVDESGVYEIVVLGKDAKGSYDIRWEAQ